MTRGLIDPHLHGYRGFDAQSADPAELLALSRLLGHKGLAGFYATYVSAPQENFLRSIRALVAVAGKETGALVLGLHLEGPFLNPRRAGAHPPGVLRKPSLAEAREWVDRAGSLLKIVTLAPELPGAERVVRYLVSEGVRVQMGHTCATAAQAKKAKGWGVTGVTHLFNAMGPLDRRVPSLADFALDDPDLLTELIVDGAHVSRDLVGHTLRRRPKDKVVFVSDACAASGFPPGHRARFAGGWVTTAKDGSLHREDGTLAAGGLLVPEALRSLALGALIPPTSGTSAPR
jgi:N-acetylglucosamine-6-phosphate deacetylase